MFEFVGRMFRFGGAEHEPVISFDDGGVEDIIDSMGERDFPVSEEILDEIADFSVDVID